MLKYLASITKFSRVHLQTGVPWGPELKFSPKRSAFGHWARSARKVLRGVLLKWHCVGPGPIGTPVNDRWDLKTKFNKTLIRYLSICHMICLCYLLHPSTGNELTGAWVISKMQRHPEMAKRDGLSDVAMVIANPKVQIISLSISLSLSLFFLSLSLSLSLSFPSLFPLSIYLSLSVMHLTFLLGCRRMYLLCHHHQKHQRCYFHYPRPRRTYLTSHFQMIQSQESSTPIKML